MLLSVIFVAVVPDEIHVVCELPNSLVEVMEQLPANRSEVHGFFDHIMVIKNIEFGWVDRLLEPKCSFDSAAHRQHFHGNFLPLLLSARFCYHLLRQIFGTCKVGLQIMVVVNELSHLFFCQIVQFTVFITMHYFVCLSDWLRVLFLLLAFKTRLLDTLTDGVELDLFSVSFQFSSQVVSSFMVFVLPCQVCSCFVVFVGMSHLSTSFH